MALVPDGELSDLDPQAIEDYRRQRARVRPDAEELHWGDPDLLRALGAVRPEGGQLKPTVAGLLLFGTPMALLLKVLGKDLLDMKFERDSSESYWLARNEDNFENRDYTKQF